jgi:hypothetical protein
MKALLIYLFVFTFFIGAQANMNEVCVNVLENNFHSDPSISNGKQIIQPIIDTKESDLLFEIEEKEEDKKKVKWLLPAIFAVCLNVSPYIVCSEQSTICCAQDITTSLPRYLVLNVFRI